MYSHFGELHLEASFGMDLFYTAELTAQPCSSAFKTT